VLVAAVSTGGHLCGTARALKEALPELEVIAVDAAGSAIFEQQYRPHLLNGIGLAWQPANVDLNCIDAIQWVTDRHAFSTCRHLAKHEGLVLGGSSGAVAFACLAAMQRSLRPRTIVGIAADSGTSYLDTVYDDKWLRTHHIVPIRDGLELLQECRNSRAFPVQAVTKNQALRRRRRRLQDVSRAR
jgi:N-(2-amino-2-carboxyethyl)-L-glutamate synthase